MKELRPKSSPELENEPKKQPEKIQKAIMSSIALRFKKINKIINNQFAAFANFCCK